MTGQVNDIIDIINYLTINCGNERKLTMDSKIQFNKVELEKMKKTYESIFSWNIEKQTDRQSYNYTMYIFDKVKEECESFCGNEFNLKRFSLQLVLCYEMYVDGNYDKSLQEIEGVVTFLGSCKFDDDHDQYLCVYNHIARATYSYVALTMDLNSITIVENVKPMIDFKPAETAAVCAVKAYVFMEYAPVGNNIGLKLADQARALQPDDLKWLVVWLTAKGRVRRYFNKFSKPEECEVQAADMLLRVKNQNISFLNRAFNIYTSLGGYYERNSLLEKSYTSHTIALDIVKKIIPLLKNNTHYLNSIFGNLIYIPKKFHSKPLFNELIEKLKITNNTHSDKLLGKYYYIVEKDYETSKMYLSRKMIVGTFGRIMELLKVECRLQSVDQFPFILVLNKIYDAFPSPSRRLNVITNMLMYYYYKDEPKEFMRCLKLYIDQNIDDTLKKQCLLSTYSLPNFPVRINEFQFLNMIKKYVERIADHNNEWTLKEKTIFNDTYLRFIKMSRVKIDQVETNGTHPKCSLLKSDNKHSRIGTDKQKSLQQYGLNERPCSWRKREGSQEHQTATLNDLREWRRPRNELDNFSGRQNAGEPVKCSWRNQQGRVPRDDETSTSNASSRSQFELRPNTKFT